MSNPIPVEISIEDESFNRYIQSFEVDRGKSPGERLTIKLDTGEELSLPKPMAKPLLDAFDKEDADE